ncbi:pyrroline-5-carboxylate reductase 3-like [Manduca sexta]|uniref:pyrroline-5-carboxylate reductase 3-like n=1 Tax=Manduca sexta TaxID=7130 RepID=UPI0018902FE0|nr:pyrroline-5-carboxylate reductase 3-like [Manduca sexta]
MSTAIFRGIMKSNGHPPSEIWVSGPNLSNLKHWSDSGAHITTRNDEIFNNCDIVFLGVKPDKLHVAISQCQNNAKKNTERNVLFVSMLGGITIKTLHQALRTLDNYANVSVVRIMPNTPMEVGTGVCLYSHDDIATEEQCTVLRKLLSCCGLFENIPESLMNSLGILTACGPAFMYIVIEALADGAVKLGVPRAMALRHASQVVAGSGQMVLQSGKHPGLLKDEVCSPGGSTICGVSELENGRLRATLIAALEAASQKTKNVGENKKYE